MKPASFKLFLAFLLFSGWISYLAILVSKTTRGFDGKPLRLSPPQFLVSTLDLIVSFDGNNNLRVDKILFSSLADKTPKVGDFLTVANFNPIEFDRKEIKNWLFPLRITQDGKTLEIVTIPPSPGFQGSISGMDFTRIYPALDGVLHQYNKFPK